MELEASRRDPYRQLGRMFHLVGVREPPGWCCHAPRPEKSLAMGLRPAHSSAPDPQSVAVTPLEGFKGKTTTRVALPARLETDVSRLPVVVPPGGREALR